MRFDAFWGFKENINYRPLTALRKDTDGELWMFFLFKINVSGEIGEKKGTETAPSVPLHVVSEGLFNWGN